MPTQNNKIKICITGGPSGGKTTLIEALQKDLGPKISVVAEAASILYRGGFPRLPSSSARQAAQRAIYFTQRELEYLTDFETTAAFMICDRGSLDSVAYWPGDGTQYFESIQTKVEKEFARYDWVLHLDTALTNGFDVTNPVRTESHREALVLNDKIKTAWTGHPQRLIITHENDFILKLAKARKVISLIMEGRTHQEISKLLSEGGNQWLLS